MPDTTDTARIETSAETMTVEIWSDVICPFCGLGNNRLEQALAGFEHRDRVEVVHRSFDLDPHATVGEARPVREMLARKYGLSAEQVAANTGRLETEAAADGLTPYIVTDNNVGNTAMAHALLAFASEQGLEDEAWHLLYRTYFGEAGDIFTVAGLVELGKKLGLDADEVRAALVDDRYADRLRADTEEAHGLGATGVPFVVIDRRYAIPGAQPLEFFTQALEQAWQDHQPQLTTLGGADADAAVCGPEGCEV